MELKVRIDDSVYYHLKQGDEIPDERNMALIAIKEGTPLEPLKGHWIEDYIESWGGWGFRCSICRKPVEKKEPTCFNCKAIMEEKETDHLPSCNSCVHNGTWDCIKCSGFDRYERRGDKNGD